MSNSGAFTHRKISRIGGDDDDINSSIWTTKRFSKLIEEIDNYLIKFAEKRNDKIEKFKTRNQTVIINKS